MKNKNLATVLCYVLSMTLSYTSFAAEGARPRPPRPTPTPPPSSPWYKARTVVCEDADLRFEVQLDEATANGLVSEGQPHFDQHAVWTATAKSAAEKRELGKFYVLGATGPVSANSLSFDGTQTGWYSPSLKTLVGTWVWIPTVTDVFKNTGIVQPRSGNFKITLEDGSVHDDPFSTMVRMDHVAAAVTVRIDSGAEGASVFTTHTFAESRCQGQDGL
jgi:hypothetical protein